MARHLGLVAPRHRRRAAPYTLALVRRLGPSDRVLALHDCSDDLDAERGDREPAASTYSASKVDGIGGRVAGEHYRRERNRDSPHSGSVAQTHQGRTNELPSAALRTPAPSIAVTWKVYVPAGMPTGKVRLIG